MAKEHSIIMGSESVKEIRVTDAGAKALGHDTTAARQVRVVEGG